MWQFAQKHYLIQIHGSWWVLKIIRWASKYLWMAFSQMRAPISSNARVDFTPQARKRCLLLRPKWNIADMWHTVTQLCEKPCLQLTHTQIWRRQRDIKFLLPTWTTFIYIHASTTTKRSANEWNSSFYSPRHCMQPTSKVGIIENTPVNKMIDVSINACAPRLNLRRGLKKP